MATIKGFSFSFLLLIAIGAALSSVVSSPEQNQNQSQDHSNSDGFDTIYELQPVILNPPTWSAVFDTGDQTDSKFRMTMEDKRTIQLTITYIDPMWGDDYELHVLPVDEALLHINRVIYAKDILPGASSWSGNFTVEAIFLGHTPIYVELQRPNLQPERASETLEVIILRKVSKWDTIFKVCVGGFVLLLYVNFGAALELDALKRILLRPVGPAIGFVGQFLIMPVLSFLIGYFLFREEIELRLGLFFTGSTPGGGASNIFTVILSGNLNLSITMTALSNLAAFGMMPLWIFTLGSLIFRDGNFAIPYQSIASMSFSLVLPLCLGIALQKYIPDLAKKMSKLIKPVSLLLIVFITIFGFTVNSYMFKLFTWKILMASSALPWIGYMIGWIMAIVCGQSSKDALTIAIETGIQNTGIAMFMLNFTLPQPQADMTSAVPVANSMMTPLPLLVIYLIRKCFCRTSTSIEEVEEAPTKIAKEIEVEAIMDKGQYKQSAVAPANAAVVAVESDK